MRTRIYWSSFCFIVLLCGCLPSDDLGEAELDNPVRDIAFPIINTAINVIDFEKESDSGNVSVRTDEEGRVTVEYDGEVVSRDWSIISPPLPIAAFSFEEPVSDVVITKPDGGNLLVDEIINRIEFAELNIKYQIKHQHPEPLSVDISIPQIMKDGLVYAESFTVPSDGVNTTHITEDFPLDGYSFITVDNEFQIIYEARLPSGEIVSLDKSAGIFQPFNASYVEGYLGTDTFPVQGNIVPVNLFDAWKSGGVKFEDPRIDLYVENALGLPLSSEFERFSITTTAGNDIDVEAEAIEDGIILNYPTLAERGEAKVTTFTFDKNNSNLKELFEERVARVNYKINAVYNKDQIVDETQFIGEGGYFSANVSVVLPLEGSINDLVLKDTIDINLGDYDNVLSGEVKTVINNEFPLDIEIQAYFLDNNQSVIDSLFSSRLMLDGAPVDGNGITQPTDSQIDVTALSEEKWNRVRSSKDMAIDLKLNTNSINESPLWVYDNYDVLIKMGAILKVNVEQ